MIDDFEALEVFLSLTQTGSVQATADELDLTAPNVSQKKSEEAPDFNQGRNRIEKRRRHSKN